MNAMLCEDVAPVGLAEFDAVPCQVRPAEQLVQAYALAFGSPYSANGVAR